MEHTHAVGLLFLGKLIPREGSVLDAAGDARDLRGADGRCGRRAFCLPVVQQHACRRPFKIPEQSREAAFYQLEIEEVSEGMAAPQPCRTRLIRVELPRM